MKNIFDNVNLGTLQLKNRLVRSATWEALGDEKGNITDKLFETYENLAKGGVGCIITGFTSVSDSDRYFGGMVRLSNDSLIPCHKKLTESVHKYSCPIIAQLALGEYFKGEADTLKNGDIDELKDLFINAAMRAEKAGYDGVQIHAAHGFYLSRFISPRYNHRQDIYGKERGKILEEIIKKIKKTTPKIHISMKINCNDFVSGGLVPSESMQICLNCVKNGLDSVEVSGNGTSVAGVKVGKNEAYFKDFALELAEKTNIPVILVGGHRSIQNMNTVLNEGKIELLSLSRPLICEPSLPNRWLSGNENPSKCISCNMCYGTPGHNCIFS